MSRGIGTDGRKSAGKYSEFHSRKAFAVTVFVGAASAVVAWRALMPPQVCLVDGTSARWSWIVWSLLLLVMLSAFWLFAPIYAGLRMISKRYKAQGQRLMRALYAGLACLLGLVLPAFLAAFAARLILSAVLAALS